jgi:transcriptional regulator with XRE-family HTH domain
LIALLLDCFYLFSHSVKYKRKEWGSMELDYSLIGKRIAQRRKELGLRQVEVCERAGINDKYLSCIERATSIPSLEVIMKLALALDTTPDAFLTGSIRYNGEEWRDIAELMRGMTATQLDLAKNFLNWLSTQSI